MADLFAWLISFFIIIALIVLVIYQVNSESPNSCFLLVYFFFLFIFLLKSTSEQFKAPHSPNCFFSSSIQQGVCLIAMGKSKMKSIRILKKVEEKESTYQFLEKILEIKIMWVWVLIWCKKVSHHLYRQGFSLSISSEDVLQRTE